MIVAPLKAEGPALVISPVNDIGRYVARVDEPMEPIGAEKLQLAIVQIVAFGENAALSTLPRRADCSMAVGWVWQQC